MKEKILQSIDMRMIAELYGLEINRSGFCKCPFHSEKTPSMKLYPKSFYCYGCGTGGDVIKFVQLYHNIGFREAMLKINDDFRLGLTMEKPQKSEKSEYMKLAHLNRQFDEWEKNTFIMVSRSFRILREWQKEYAPKSPNDTPDERFRLSLELLDRVEYLNSIFIKNDREEKLMFFKFYRKEADEIAQRIHRLNTNHAG